MKKSHLEHVLRAAGAICEDNEFIIIGSQSLVSGPRRRNFDVPGGRHHRQEQVDVHRILKPHRHEPHDLAVAKLAAGRDKDHIFIRALLERGLVDPDTVRTRIEETKVSAQQKQQMAALLARLVASIGC